MSRQNAPWLVPILNPTESLTDRRRARIRRGLAGLLLLSAALLAIRFYAYPLDRTKGLAPEAVAEAAGMAVMGASGYRFSVAIDGSSRVGVFPASQMEGTYQRMPRVLYLIGNVLSGDRTINLEYYLEGRDLYVRDPRTRRWLLMRDANLDELDSFAPDNLAAPLVSGVLAAQEIGRERIDGKEAVILRLDLDPAVMLPRLTDGQNDLVEYRLWVYTRSLRPARLTIDVTAPVAERHEREVLQFSYRMDWNFGRQPTLVVPDQVKRFVLELDQAVPTPGLIPGQ